MGGSKTYNNTTTTGGSSQADLPAWAKPYFERNLAKAEAEYGKALSTLIQVIGLRVKAQDTLDAISKVRVTLLIEMLV